MAIVEDKDVRCGKPVIEGTRVAVEDIVETFFEVSRGVEEIASDFNVEEEEVEEALRYHHRHHEQSASTVSA